MLTLSLSPIATGETKKALIARTIFDQTQSFDPAQRARILTQIKRACDIALNEIPVIDESSNPSPLTPNRYISDLALIQVQEELASEHRDHGKTFIDGAPYTVNVKEKWDLSKVEHPRHDAAKTWQQWDALQTDLKEQSATCTRKKTDAVKDYTDAYPDEQPTSVEYTLSIGD